MRRLLQALRTRFQSESSRELLQAGSGALVLRVVGTACTLFLHILLARLMGVDSFGVYVYVLSWISLASTMLTLGLDTAALRFIPTYRSEGDLALLREFVRRTTGWVSMAVITLTALCVPLLVVLGERLPRSLFGALAAAVFLLLLLPVLLLGSSFLRALKRVVSAMLPQWILRPVLVGLGALIVSGWLRQPPSAMQVVSIEAGVVAISISIVYGLLLTSRPYREGRRQTPTRSETGLWLREGLSLMIVTTVRLSMNRVDILMVGSLIGTAEAGIYAMASQVAILIGFGLMAVNMIAAPLFAQLQAEQRRSELQQIVRLGTFVVLAFSLIVGATELILGRWILGLFGSEFRAGYPVLVVLILSQIGGSATGSVGFLMSMSGRAREAARVTVAFGLLNLALNAALIPSYGPIGAAFATTISNLGWNLVLSWSVWRLLRINPTVFGRIRVEGGGSP